VQSRTELPTFRKSLPFSAFRATQILKMEASSSETSYPGRQQS